MHLNKARFVFTGLTFLSICSAADLTGPGAAPRHGPIMINKQSTTSYLVSSFNWSGYVVPSDDGSVTDVKGSWLVPPIQGPCQGPNRYAGFWVGMDGFSNATAEQIGTVTACQDGTPTYYAWFEFFPQPPFTINSVPIKPFDVISAEVKYDGWGRFGDGQFTVSITNVTTGQSFSTSSQAPGAQRSSAEWIVEAPFNPEFGTLPLANFNVVVFGKDIGSLIGMDIPAIDSTCFATVDGNTDGIRNFPQHLPIDMVTPTGLTMARTSGADFASFVVNWFYPGP